MRFLAACVVMAYPVAGFAADLAVKATTADPPAELAAAVRGVLAPNAVTVSDADGTERLTVWFRSVVPAAATAPQAGNGLTYREIPDGTLVGAVQFARPFTDFRKQEVPAGVYTLRFAVQPDTGDHTGTAPHPEFLLLVPAEKDTTADAVEPKTVVTWSSAVTGGDHPAVMLLFPNFGAGAGPKLVEKDDGVVVAATRRPVDANGAKASLGFALVVAGHSKTR